MHKHTHEYRYAHAHIDVDVDMDMDMDMDMNMNHGARCSACACECMHVMHASVVAGCMHASSDTWALSLRMRMLVRPRTHARTTLVFVYAPMRLCAR